MGGSWDSTNTADGDVAVFAPIDLDHADRLGETIARDRDASSPGIIKTGAAVVSAAAGPRGRRRAASRGRASASATIAFEGDGLRARSTQRLAVGGQLISVRGLAGAYDDEYLPLFGAHQGHNAALAIAAVESLIGGGSAADRAATSSPRVSRRRPRPVGCSWSASSPTVIVDAAHNPHGAARARRRAAATRSTSTSGASCSACSRDKDAAGIVADARAAGRRTCSRRRRTPTAPTTPTRSPTSPRRAGCRSRVHRDARRRRRGGARVGGGIRSARRRRSPDRSSSRVRRSRLAAAEDWKAGWQRVTDVAAPAARASRGARAARANRSDRSCSAFESIVVFLGGLVDLRAQGAARADRAVVGDRRRRRCSRSSMIADRGLAALPLGDRRSAGSCRSSSRSAASSCPRSFVVAIIFGGMWAYATIKGGVARPRANARLAAEADNPNGD